MSAAPVSNPMRAYAAVTAAYWAFMLTDGALRMLVLLYFNTLGFSPIELAWLFLLYEVAGIITNLAAGWLAARFGLASTLYAGLALQIVALAALTQVNPQWSQAALVIYVMAVQGLSGVAKDLSKMSSKSAVKLLAPNQEGGAFGAGGLYHGLDLYGCCLGRDFDQRRRFIAQRFAADPLVQGEVVRLAIQRCAREPFVFGADVPLWRARCLVCRWHSYLFSSCSLGWHGRGAARGVFPHW